MPHGVKRAMISVAAVAAIVQGGLAASLPSAGQQLVEGVRVKILTATPLPAVIEERIAASVSRVAEKIVVGRTLTAVQAQKNECEGIIREVFTRILTGYRIESLNIVAGREVLIEARLAPEGPQVRTVQLSLETPGLNADASVLIRLELDGKWSALCKDLVGLPAASFSWTEPLLLPALAEAVSQDFPGFQVSASAVPGETMILTLKMHVNQQAIQSVQVGVTSTTLPRIVASMWQQKADEYLQSLAGLPVAYLRRKQLEYEARATAWLNSDPMLARLGLQWRVNLYPGTATRAECALEAQYYALTLHGTVAVADQMTLGFSTRIGIKLFGNWEIAGEMLIDTSGLGLDWSGSLIYALNDDLDLGFTYRTRRPEHLLWLRYASGHGDLFIVQGDLVLGEYSATIGLMQENEYALTLTVDSQRQYCLTFEIGF